MQGYVNFSSASARTSQKTKSPFQRTVTARRPKNTHVFVWGVGYFCWILTNIALCRQTWGQVPNIKFNETPSGGSGALPCRRTDGGKKTWPG